MHSGQKGCKLSLREQLLNVKREKINTCSSSSIVWVDDVIPGKLLLILLVASGVDQHATETGSLCLFFRDSNFKRQFNGCSCSRSMQTEA